MSADLPDSGGVSQRPTHFVKQNFLQYIFDNIELLMGPPMNLTALQTFLTIVETGSLVRASERLNVTQSTVTARLKALEDQLGQTLLLRQKSGAELTSSGFKFKRYAEAMTELWRQARQETSLPDGIEAVCKIGCHMDLWPILGRRFFGEIHHGHPETALSAWPGEQADLDRWLGTGLIDAALTYQPTAHENQTIHTLRTEPLVLVSTRPGSPMRFDPGYVYVDAGEEFGRRHAAAYADADTAKVSFGCAVWALDHLMEHGGSAYLPKSLAAPHLATGALHEVSGAPVFGRTAYLITNDAAAESWPWLPALVERLSD